MVGAVKDKIILLKYADSVFGAKVVGVLEISNVWIEPAEVSISYLVVIDM